MLDWIMMSKFDDKKLSEIRMSLCFRHNIVSILHSMLSNVRIKLLSKMQFFTVCIYVHQIKSVCV